MDEMQRNYEVQMQILREENAAVCRKEEGIPSTPTVPDPLRLSRVQQHREAERVESHLPPTGQEQSQPPWMEKTQASRGNPSHTMVESSGANEGGHPSRQPIHASGNLPFTQFILETPLLERWKMPTFDKYDRTTNPDNHMRVFSTSLTGEALEWFSELSANNIYSFATLKARFSTQFAPLRPAILTVDNLVNIRQEDGESRRSYLDRYNRMSVKIKDLSDEIARHHFSYGLQPGVFVDKISRKKPKTMEEMRERAAKFIQMEDMQEFRVKKREKEDAASQKSAPRPSKPLARPSEKKTPKFTTYTPLTLPRAKILQDAFSADSLPASRKKPPPPDVNGSKHYQYHRTIGHTTKECHTLRDKIEELIR
ncbi:uncharacterized protein LOC114165469 [Vigna unguiculata]|uniref:uncharacterized protein LOC114165469 n=1 Tax=Vigna unguiculata TaxID=3917 RepID=UPI001016D196|nr:uncharacterized protein LOC114165469 [Vigna unguiculata]